VKNVKREGERSGSMARKDQKKGERGAVGGESRKRGRQDGVIKGY